MQAVLSILFIIVYFFTYDICSSFYDPYEQTQEWYYLRDKIIESLFLLAILIPWFKRTLFSESVLVFDVVLIAFSIVDKVFLEVFTNTDKDWFIILPLASSICYAYYHKRKI